MQATSSTLMIAGELAQMIELGFALGSHHCLGLHLARLEARIALERIFTRLPNCHADLTSACEPYGCEFRKPTELTLVWD